MTATILVVEDEPMIRKLLRRLLQAKGHKVYEERNGLEAWQHFAKKSFDLMITDSHLPGMEGRELIERVRGVCPGFPIIHITGESPRVSDGFPSDICTFCKPFAFDALAAEVQVLLARSYGDGPHKDTSDCGQLTSLTAV